MNSAFKNSIKRSLLLFRVKMNKPKSIYLFSDKRSGSTWLQESLRERLIASMIWEPLKLEDSNSNLRMTSPEYLLPIDNSINEIIDESLGLKKVNSWSLSKEKLITHLRSNLFLVKTVRSNGLLSYLLDINYFDTKPILLLRHPISVAISKQNSWSNHAQDTLEKLMSGKVLNDNIIKKDIKLIERFKNNLEVSVYIWCVLNSKLVNNFEFYKKKLIFTFYEELGQENSRSMKELKSYLSMPNNTSILNSQPSSTTDKSHFEVKNNLQMDNEKPFQEIEFRTLEVIGDILNYFNVNIYNLTSHNPQYV